jgi:hypothetical protein
MKIDRISVQPLLPTGNYLNMRVGIDYVLEPFDDPKAALNAAYELAIEFHKEKYPKLYKEGKPIYTDYIGEEEPPIIQQRKITPGMQMVIDKINNSTTPEQLEKERTRADMNPIIKEIFNEKLKTLQNG